MTIAKSLFDYGAVGNGTTDDTAAIQSAFSDPAQYELIIPSNTFKITSPIIQNKVMQLYGCGQDSIIDASFTGSHNGAIIVQLGSDPLRNGGIYESFTVSGNCPSVYFDLSSGAANYINRWAVRDCLFNNTAGGVAVQLNNPVNTDGLFCSTFENNIVVGGFDMPNIGDSVTFRNNSVTGSNNGFNLTAVPGAAHVKIEDNNITCSGFAVLAGTSMNHLHIIDNNMENTNGGSAQAQIVAIYGTSANPLERPIFKGNSLNGNNQMNPAGSLLAIGYCNDAIVDENAFNGAAVGCCFFSTSVNGRWGMRNIGNATSVLSNLSSSTIIES